MIKQKHYWMPVLIAGILLINSCSKGGDDTPGDPCAGVTVVVSATTTNPTTAGGTNGSITASAVGGSGFTYSLNGGAYQPSGTFSNLGDGVYIITAKNANGCTGSASYTLAYNNPCSGVTVTVTATTVNPATAASTDGSINASATGGTGFTFSLNGGAFQASGNFTNLGAGTYTVTAKNSNGCLGTNVFTLTPVDVCAGVTVTVTGTVTNPTTPSSNNGSIVANATGGTGFTFSLNGGAFQASGTFNNLDEGNYIITAKNSNGCTGAATFTLTAPDPCAGITINVTGTPGNVTPCVTPVNGSINANATGSTGFTFSLNGGAFQPSGSFTGLAAGNYTVTAKDANGCTGSVGVTVGTAAAGPLFTAVKNVLTANCVTCHNPGNPNGGMIWTVDCNIVQFKDRIKARAVDQGTMPPTGALPQSEKDKITAWINAGGRFTD